MIKILILRFSSIGDIVLTTPIIRALKKQLPQAEIHYFTKASFKIILENNPYIDRLWLLEENLGEQIEQLKKEEFDYVVDLHKNLRTWTIKKKLDIKNFTFNKINFEKWLMVNFKIDLLPDKHIVDRYFETIQLLDVTNDNEGLDYFIPPNDKINLRDLPPPLQKSFVVIAIGAQHNTKKLPFLKLVELCNNVSSPIILLGGKEDEDTGNKVLQDVKQSAPEKIIYNYCGQLNLNQSASLIEQAEKVYSHDTGLMHIAAAFKKNIVSIWGSTIPKLGMYPYGTKYNIIENNNLPCRPCTKIGYQKCPLGHFKCMNDLTFQQKKTPKPL